MVRYSSPATVIMQCHMIMVASAFLLGNCGVKPPGDLGDQRNLTSASVVSFGLSSRIQWPVSFSTETEMPDIWRIVDRLPSGDTGEKRIHHHQLLRFRWELRGIRVRYHQSNIVTDNSRLLDPE